MTKFSNKEITRVGAVEVDQSVKVEELNRDTVIGISDSKDVDIAYILSRRIKRRINEQFRRVGKSKQCAPTVFAAAVVAVLRKEGILPGRIVIDTEYSGYEKSVCGLVSLYFPRAVVVCQRIGRGSSAHAAAYNTHLGNRKENGVLSYADIDEVIRKQKTAGEPQRPGLTGVRKSSRPVNKNNN